MTNPEVGIMMLGLFIFMVMLGFPIAFTLVAMGLGFGYTRISTQNGWSTCSTIGFSIYSYRTRFP